jgi:hypothetical protein
VAYLANELGSICQLDAPAVRDLYFGFGPPETFAAFEFGGGQISPPSGTLAVSPLNDRLIFNEHDC